MLREIGERILAQKDFTKWVPDAQKQLQWLRDANVQVPESLQKEFLDWITACSNWKSQVNEWIEALKRGKASPPPTNYGQAVLDYYLRVMQQMLLVCDTLWRGGTLKLAKTTPSYAITNSPTTDNGFSGNLYVTNKLGEGKFCFPKEWPELAKVIESFIKDYPVTGFFGVDLTWGDQLSHNWPWFPGIAMNQGVFFGNMEDVALNELLHESMHNFGYNTWYSGLGHSSITPLVAIGEADDVKCVFSRVVTFLQNAQTVDGKSLWDAILAASEKPKKP